ncbi:MAG: response regulator [Candidatus Sericytochromatia bacterium]|nr:response regulator [Candidatus Sericytochromatia bacterium]
MSSKYLILVVDDEPDMHSLSRLSLKNLKYQGKGVELAFASSGQEAVAFMREHPETAVVLLDVVMETSTAGLDACQTIRTEIGNEFVRILLRTGQPGAAPEKKVIDDYDIDGYLAKAELTSNRLYTAVRTAIKAYQELLELQRHREVLNFLHDSVTGLHLTESLEASLQQVLETAVVVAPVDLAVLHLETFENSGYSQRYLLYTGTEPNEAEMSAAAQALVSRVADDPGALALKDAGYFAEGFLVPLVLNQELGYGWLYLQGQIEDGLQLQALPMLAAHAANALYAHLLRASARQDQTAFYAHVAV